MSILSLKKMLSTFVCLFNTGVEIHLFTCLSQLSVGLSSTDDLLDPVLGEGDGEHDQETRDHPQQLEAKTQPVTWLLTRPCGQQRMGVATTELRDHVHL